MSPAKLKAVPSPSPLTQSIARAQNLLLSHQQPEGYWWYTLEANETIGSGYIQLTHFLGCVDSDIEAALLTHMLDQ